MSAKIRATNRVFLLTVLFACTCANLLHIMQLTKDPVISNILLQLCLAFVPIIYLAFNREDFLKIYRKPMKPAVLLLSIPYLLLLFPGTTFINNLSLFVAKNYANMSEMKLNNYPFLAVVFATCVMPAVLEETIYRGIFFNNYKKAGIVRAAILSGLLFGLMHRNLNQFCYATYIGIMLALICESTGTIYTTMIVHFLNNFYSTTVGYKISNKMPLLFKPIKNPSTKSEFIIWGLASVIYTILALLLNRLARRITGSVNQEENNESQSGHLITPSLIVGMGILAFYIAYEYIR